MQGKGKTFYGEILTKKNVQGIVVDNILDIMPILHDVEVDLMLEDLEIPKKSVFYRVTTYGLSILVHQMMALNNRRHNELKKDLKAQWKIWVVL